MQLAFELLPLHCSLQCRVRCLAYPDMSACTQCVPHMFTQTRVALYSWETVSHSELISASANLVSTSESEGQIIWLNCAAFGRQKWLHSVDARATAERREAVALALSRFFYLTGILIIIIVNVNSSSASIAWQFLWIIKFFPQFLFKFKSALPYICPKNCRSINCFTLVNLKAQALQQRCATFCCHLLVDFYNVAHCIKFWFKTTLSFDKLPIKIARDKI